MKNFKNALLPTVASALLLVSCDNGDDDGEKLSNNDLLLGDWELVKEDGEPQTEETDSSRYSVHFEFLADGDFKQCFNEVDKTTPANSYEYCYEPNGSWEWNNTQQTEIGIFSFGDSSVFKIRTLTADKLVGEITFGEEPYEDTYEWELQKVE